jgi:tight adherence protein B
VVNETKAQLTACLRRVTRDRIFGRVPSVSASERHCTLHLISGELDLHPHLLFASLGSALLLGGTLLQALRGARRKASLESRLRSLTTVRPNTHVVVPSVRRALPRGRNLPTGLLNRLDASLAATGNQIRLPHLIAAAILADVTIGFASTVTQTPPPLAIALSGAATFVIPALLVRLAQKRHQRRFLDVFPDALDLIVRAVRGGLPVLEAIELTASEIDPPVGMEFGRMLGEIQIGVDIEDALQHAADRIRVSDFRFFVVSLVLQRQTGGGIAEILSGLSTIIRQRKALRAKARALAAEAMASTALVAAMPFVAGAGLFLINRDMISVLFIDPRGRFMLGVAMGSLFLGIAVMKAIIRRNLR